MKKFKAEIEIIGINPFVFVPSTILAAIFKSAGKEKGAIPVSGTINGAAYKQTLVRYRGDWRLYINTTMLKNSPKRIGEEVSITIAFDEADRSIQPHAQLVKALEKNEEARAVFDGLRPSLRHEVVRYIDRLKSAESVEKNVARAINWLLGKERFIGRDRP